MYTYTVVLLCAEYVSLPLVIAQTYRRLYPKYGVKLGFDSGWITKPKNVKLRYSIESFIIAINIPRALSIDHYWLALQGFGVHQ